MSGFSDSYKDAILSHIFQGEVSGTSLDQPSNLWFALHSSIPTIGNEIAGGGYGRVLTLFDVSDSKATNSSIILFDGLPSAIIRYWAVWDAQINGSIVIRGAFDSNKTLEVNSGSSLSWAIGDFSFTLTDT